MKDTGLPVVYVNMLGGQDELIFDGGSFVMNAQGEVVQRVPPYVEGLFPVDIDLIDGRAALAQTGRQRCAGNVGARQQDALPIHIANFGQDRLGHIG